MVSNDDRLMEELLGEEHYAPINWRDFPELGEEDDGEGEEIPSHISQWLVEAQNGDHAVRKAATPDQRLVTGWASVLTEPDDSPLSDREGDVILEEDLIPAVRRFMEGDRHAGEVHSRTDGKVRSVGKVVESLVMTKELRQSLGLPSTFPTGWLITMKVSDDAVWDKVKTGTYRSFSVGGSGEREPLA